MYLCDNVVDYKFGSTSIAPRFFFLCHEIAVCKTGMTGCDDSVDNYLISYI